MGVLAHEVGPFRPLDLVRVRREEYRKKYHSAGPQKSSEEDRVARLKAIDQTLVKHGDGAFATAPKEGLANLSRHFLKYIERCALPRKNP